MAACLSDCHISNLSCLDSSLGEIMQPIWDSWREISTPPPKTPLASQMQSWQQSKYQVNWKNTQFREDRFMLVSIKIIQFHTLHTLQNMLATWIVHTHSSKTNFTCVITSIRHIEESISTLQHNFCLWD